MGPTTLLPFQRKACWEFFHPEKSDGFGRVSTRELKASTLPLDHQIRLYWYFGGVVTGCTCHLVEKKEYVSENSGHLRYMPSNISFVCMCVFINCWCRLCWAASLDDCLQWFSEAWESLVLFQGAHFSRDTINRPGFAKLFFEAASEERQHAIKIISYLVMRGNLTTNINELIQNPVSNPSSH
jgi:hypothetical protein